MLDIEVIRLSSLWAPHSELCSLSMQISQAMPSGLEKYYTNWQDLKTELSLVFTDDKHIAQLNASWRSLNKATNVLSFPAYPIKIGEQPKPLLGDIIFAFETIKNQAKEQNKDFYQHLSHLFIHGFLHLLGFDHDTDEAASVMENIECDILKQLQISNPYILQ